MTHNPGIGRPGADDVGLSYQTAGWVTPIFASYSFCAAKKQRKNGMTQKWGRGGDRYDTSQSIGAGPADSWTVYHRLE